MITIWHRGLNSDGCWPLKPPFTSISWSKLTLILDSVNGFSQFAESKRVSDRLRPKQMLQFYVTEEGGKAQFLTSYLKKI